MENLLLVLALSIDAFVASIAYGTNKIKIPFPSIIIINILCSLSLGFSLFLGSHVMKILPRNVAAFISFIILILLGIYYLFESITKIYIKNKLGEKIKIKLFDFWFVVDIYIDCTKADTNHSKKLNSKESVYLALALSLDSLAVGFGNSLGNINYINVIILSLIIGLLSIWSGLALGKRIVERSSINLSWLSGILLIVLAILKLI